MRNDKIGELIEELKRLRLQESIVLAQLEAETNRRNETAEQEIEPDSTGIGRPNVFRVGDRVRVINRFRRPINWHGRFAWDENVGRNATVTHISNGRVYFTTDNGVETWRLPDNLRRL